jgi:hypothetical protein
MNVVLSANCNAGSLNERRNTKMNEGKAQVIYFSRRLRVPEDGRELNKRNIPFIKYVKYLGVIFDRRMSWRYHIERTPAKALGTYIETYSRFKSNV